MSKNSAREGLRRDWVVTRGETSIKGRTVVAWLKKNPTDTISTILEVIEVDYENFSTEVCRGYLLNKEGERQEYVAFPRSFIVGDFETDAEAIAFKKEQNKT